MIDNLLPVHFPRGQPPETLRMPVPFIVAIPARLGSTRLPRKALREIAGKPLVLHVVDRARAAGAEAVVVATDAEEIAEVVRDAGADVAMTRAEHASGSDRLAQVAADRGWADDVVVVNLQGDEPLAPPAGIRQVAELLARAGTAMATLAEPIEDGATLLDPNAVKLVRAANGNALYFSRAAIPWARDHNAAAWMRHELPAPPPGVALRHIGIYAYRAGFLRRFVALPRTPLEQLESLEQLRALEHGHAIAVEVACAAFPGGVDVEADVARVARLLAVGGLGAEG